MKKLGIAVFAVLLLSGCADEPFQNNAQNSLSNMYDPSQQNALGTQVDISTLKKGTDCQTRVLGLGPFGSKSAIDAAKDGKIRKVITSENTYHDYVIFNRDCIDVYGQ